MNTAEVGHLRRGEGARWPAAMRAGAPAGPWRAGGAACVLLLWWLLSLLSPAVRAAEPAPTLAVVYPDVGEPYRGVFAKIIEGIEDTSKGPVLRIPVAAGADAKALAADLRRHGVRAVIALGRSGLKAATAAGGDVAIVAGGIVGVPEDADPRTSLHSLAPDPDLLFARLKSMVPTVKRVFVVHDPRQNDWLMALARQAAARHGLELEALAAPDLRTATLFYQEFFGQADPKRDALWLPQDSTTVEESSVLPMILQESWNRGAVVFSSSVGHVGRGALFSLYPDNLELGRTLAASALGRLAADARPPAVRPLQEVLVAVNVRTARHLGLAITHRQQQGFDLVFPQQ